MSETSSATPLSRAASAALPWSTSRGRLGAASRDLHLAQAKSAEPERLDRRLLGREARGEVAAGAAPCGGELELGGREEALRQPRPALQRALQPLDLDHVDADPWHGHG